jgi:hypothetical protein
MIEASLKSGQKALQPLPSKSVSDKRNLQSYPVAEALLQDRKSLKSDEEAGIAVVKVTKVNKASVEKSTPGYQSFLTVYFRTAIQITTSANRHILGSKEFTGDFWTYKVAERHIANS